MTDTDRSNRLKLISAFAAVYLIWGSTYLAIRFAIETLPGFTMAGVRFLLAGTVLVVWARLRGAAWPTAREWRSALIIGGFLLLGGNGLVVWAEHHIPSGWAALLVGTEPLWVMLIMLAMPGGKRPTPRTVFAILVGFAGVVVLTAPGASQAGEIHLGAALAVLLGAASWAFGSLYARRAELPASPRMATAAQMLTGGALLAITGAGLGEWQTIDPSVISMRSMLAFAYLVIFGSLAAFSAYSWLIRNVEPTLAATYAYVNPVVAIFLGWLLASEPLGTRTWIAMTMIVGAVVLLSLRRRRGRGRLPAQRSAPEAAVGAVSMLAEPVLERCRG